MWHWRNRRDEELDDEAGQLEVSELLRPLDTSRPEPGPYFSTRVVAAIEVREAELAGRTRAWAAVPSFASRLAAIAVLVLLVAGTWLYEGSLRRQFVTGGIFEDSAAAAASTSQDEVFALPGEDGR